MKPMWRQRAFVVVLVGAAVEIGLVLGGMGPRLALVAALVVFVAAALYLALDLGDTVALAEWPSTDRRPRSFDGVEWRVGTLRMLLVSEQRSGASPRLRELLVDLIDDHLAAEHRIDRHADPVAAASVIGPELTAFVSSQHSSERAYKPAGIARIVTLIEDL